MSDTGLIYVVKDGRIVLNIKVIPGSSKSELAGIYNGMIKAKVSVAPEKGKANQALVELLSEKFNIPKSQIAITSGLTSKIKQVSIKHSANVLDLILSIGK
ncbi:MAG: hypothetical protein A2Y10_12765 [Planctomycetes bacterium GWF2_41_51]|nr:MAG: hypothetical protein A2Y10_12765 [Planctomycetes bacterium GWF2_41_51]HBG27306.1 DUF167 domain-containing protein [Phycisphaerales bacterium]